jgi:hypothetical protein
LKIAAFQTRVVLDADTGERRDLIPAQTADPASSVDGQTGPLRSDLVTAGLQKITDFRRFSTRSRVGAPPG